jgi:MoaA/NifB/PqqE/SkfB family radical SAM enzyme
MSQGYLSDIKRGLRYIFSGRGRQRYNALKNLAFDRQFARRKLVSYPVIVQVEVTNRCNLKCRICARRYSEMETADMPEEIVQQVEALFPYVSEVYLFGYGEPLLSSAFFYLLERATAWHVPTSFFTNGFLLDETLITNLLKYRLGRVTFSVDGANPSTFRYIRGGDLNKLLGKIRLFVEKAQTTRWRPREVWIEFVVMKQNISELPAVVELASKLGLSGVRVSHLVVWHEQMAGESLIACQSELNKTFQEARRRAAKVGIQLILPHTFKEKQARLPRCFYPWSNVYIRQNGLVNACCYSDFLVMGDLNQETFWSIWNGSCYQKLRREVNSNSPPRSCCSCEYRIRYTGIPSNYRDIYFKYQKESNQKESTFSTFSR